MRVSWASWIWVRAENSDAVSEGEKKNDRFEVTDAKDMLFQDIVLLFSMLDVYYLVLASFL